MSDVYNLTNITPSVQGLMQFANTATSGIFGNSIVLLVWAVVFLITKASMDVTRSVATASFIGFLVAFILFLGGMVSWQVVGLLIMLTILSAAFVRG